MSDASAVGGPHSDVAEDATMRAHRLRQQADWCVSMAAKVIDPRMFRAYVDAAAIYQEQALAIESGLGRGNPA